MGRKARTICTLCDQPEEIEVGKRSIHLVEKHKRMPPPKWLAKHGLLNDLEKIASAMKKDRNLRPPYRWIYQYFDFARAIV